MFPSARMNAVAPLSGPRTATPPREDPEVSNPTRRIAFFFALGLIFFRYSLLHEVLASYAGTSAYVLYILAIPALVGLVGSGGIQRSLAAVPIRYWLLFVGWLLLSVPFSTWKGESVQYASDYIRTDLPMLFIMGAMALTWNECRAILTTMGIAGLCNIAAGLLMTKNFGDRVGLEFGIVSNPNDYAGHLLLITPLVIFLVLSPPKQMVLRIIIRLTGIVGIGVSLYLILMTASRGALIALVMGVLFVLWKSNMKVRLAALIGVPLLALLLGGLLSDPVRTRLKAISLENDAASQDSSIPVDEAEESGRLRRFLLDESIRLSFARPLFGVGPGQFGNYEKKAASWHSTHNSFTQISAECGLPALFFYLAGMISGLRLLLRTWKQARSRPEFREIALACYCLSLSYLMFCSAIFFLNFGYFFYLPAATGLFISVSRGAQREFAALGVLKNAPRVSGPVVTGPAVRGQTITAKANGALKPVSVAAAPQLSSPQRAFRFNRYR